MIVTSIFSSVHVLLCRKNTFVVKINISIQFVTNLTKGENSFNTQNNKTHALFRVCFLRYIRIYNLKVSFNFHKTFLQLRFFPYFRLDNTNFFRFALKVRVIGIRLYIKGSFSIDDGNSSENVPFFQSLWRLFQFAENGKCTRISLELIS